MKSGLASAGPDFLFAMHERTLCNSINFPDSVKLASEVMVSRED